MNDHLEIEYLNQYKDGVHFMIRINPIEHKHKGIPHKKDIITTYKLKDGKISLEYNVELYYSMKRLVYIMPYKSYRVVNGGVQL
ncbi:hypothetical protein PMSM_12905 [Paenibacillus macquariensis subsp. macquariensis]|uniref:Transposase n=1 Tax=Paenibacillus macquariensis TaxID=948756 RepID=A0ABY1JU29_9BACL|nr:hypothetical protein PMSM_12905 [Paenibacillus macquariensis subsp. macquariensis]SIQ78366.1 hypothetical protein SAMN05421578_10434 [Paenibacillus macquariensis]